MWQREQQCLEQLSEKNEQAKREFYALEERGNVLPQERTLALTKWNCWSLALHIAQSCLGK